MIDDCGGALRMMQGDVIGEEGTGRPRKGEVVPAVTAAITGIEAEILTLGALHRMRLELGIGFRSDATVVSAIIEQKNMWHKADEPDI
jgi:hypothetical protein